MTPEKAYEILMDADAKTIKAKGEYFKSLREMDEARLIYWNTIEDIKRSKLEERLRYEQKLNNEIERKNKAIFDDKK